MSTITPTNSHPLLSIIMPFYNNKEMVAEMMDSIIANDYHNWELLAIDDGSTIETINYLKRYEEDNRIQIIRRSEEPKGAQTCRNIGIIKARGEYIIFFDSDDFITPHCLRQRVESISKEHHVDFMVFPSGSYNGYQFSKSGPYIFGYPIFKDDLKAFLQRTLPFTVWTNIYRTSSLRKHKLFWDTKILSFQDSDFNIQALLHGFQYKYSNTLPDYGYRTINNTGSISKKIISEDHRKSHLYFIEKQYQEVQKFYGKHYNKSLFHGILYIYTFLLSTNFDIVYAKQMAEIVCRYDKPHGYVMLAIINLRKLLATFLPHNLARQLSTPIFLAQRRWIEHKERKAKQEFI